MKIEDKMDMFNKFNNITDLLNEEKRLKDDWEKNYKELRIQKCRDFIKYNKKLSMFLESVVNKYWISNNAHISFSGSIDTQLDFTNPNDILYEFLFENYKFNLIFWFNDFKNNQVEVIINIMDLYTHHNKIRIKSFKDNSKELKYKEIESNSISLSNPFSKFYIVENLKEFSQEEQVVIKFFENL